MTRLIATFLVAAMVAAMGQAPADFRTLIKDRTITPADLVREFEAPPADAYRLDAGDEITIDVWMHPDLTSHQIVGPDGKITLAIHGPMKVSGLTREEAQTAIVTALARYYTDLTITVRVDHYNAFRIFVLGRVGVPGSLAFTKQPTLLEVLSRAGSLPVGGVGAEKAALVRCAVFRGRDKIIWIDLKSILTQGNLALNIRLASDDLVYLPDADDRLVYVLGFVKSPGAFNLTPAMSFLDALSLAGGPTEDSALSKISLIRTRTGSQREVSVKDLLLGKTDINYALEEGDIIYVPPRTMQKFGYVMQKLSALAGFAIVGTAIR